MRSLNLNVSDSIGIVGKSEYEREKEGRMLGEDLFSKAKYKVRFAPIPRTVACYGIDFLCQVEDVRGPTSDDIYDLEVAIIDQDGKPIASTVGSCMALSLSGIILQLRPDDKPIHNSDCGYLLSAIDGWDLGIAELSEANNVTSEVEEHQLVPIMI